MFNEAKINSFISGVFKYKKIVRRGSGRNRRVHSLRIEVNVVVMLKSTESANGKSFCKTNSCHGASKCVQLPYSKTTECQCVPKFDGDKCQKYSPNSLASTLDLLVKATLKIPTLTDIFFNVKDLRQNLEVGLTNIDNALNKLQSALETKFSKLSEEIGQNFQWTNLNVNYAKTIRKLRHFIHEFQTRSKDYNDERGVQLAKHILAPGRIKQWLYDLNNLFKGSQSIVQDHPPLMIAYMNRYSSNACSKSYKTRIDNAYRQFSVLQQQAYVMWAEALFITERRTDIVASQYFKNLNEQVIPYFLQS